MIEIEPYDSGWPNEFGLIGASIRDALGDRAIAIHHIGSTSVPGLAAKDIIDVQITVSDLSETIVSDMVAFGFILRPFRTDHCPPGMSLPPEELGKLMFIGPGRKANIHVRIAGKFNQRYPLLCRDYLRSHKTAADAYGEIKVQLAKYFPDNVDAYYDIKDPVFDVLMTGANEWAQSESWDLPPTDA